MTPIPIIIPVSDSGGGDMTLEQAVFVIAFMLLLGQYTIWVVRVLESDFDDKLEALLWLIPGWPVFPITFAIFRNFWSL